MFFLIFFLRVQIAAQERVHKIDSWEALKRRLAPDRRVFVWHHPSLPSEPLVVLHVALCDAVATNMHQILQQSSSAENEPKPNMTGRDLQHLEPQAAVFYSISSTKPGLAGVDLGNNLIKAAAKQLLAEFPTLTTLATLSPMPGFAAWLDAFLARQQQICNEQEVLLRPDEKVALSDALIASKNVVDAQGVEGLGAAALLKAALDGGTWARSQQLTAALEAPMLRLAARYIVQEKHRGRAYDPVANFHLRNGANVRRLNWCGDMSAAGLKRSHGIMVNYGYDLEAVEENNRRYLVAGEIAMSEEVAALLEGL